MQLSIFLSFPPSSAFFALCNITPYVFKIACVLRNPENSSHFEKLRLFSPVASFNLAPSDIGTLLDRRVGFVYHPPIISSLAFRLEERDICPL